MSAIEDLIERRLMFTCPIAYNDKAGDGHWTEATIEALDAALEYWLLVAAAHHGDAER